MPPLRGDRDRRATAAHRAGYRAFCCQRCRRVCNDRIGTSFNHVQYPTDLVLLVVIWRLRDKLRLRDLAEMFLARDVAFSNEAVRD